MQDHATAAARATPRRRDRCIRRRSIGHRLPGHGQQRTRTSEVRLTHAIAEQPVMADAMKAVRQHVQQKAADELIHAQPHHLGALTSLVPIILPVEADPIRIAGDQPAV